ncbi:hypothetical protein EDB86DRAFT_2828954 [Lactarius hatsudake]|nr:hypothetical protein EDB86DRAFT_2831916 [Lactarius hatsudake]KAH8997216.1 hypothetical protein EDB86DRAFT_2828954 [Lactarius hatsudake]
MYREEQTAIENSYFVVPSHTVEDPLPHLYTIYSDKLESDDLSDVPANELDRATSSESDPSAQGSACEGSQHSYASTHRPPVPTPATARSSPHLTISTPRPAGSDFDIDTDLSLSPPAGHRRVPFTSEVPGLRYSFHSKINGKPCRQDGSYPTAEQLRPSSPPAANSTNWGAFESKEGFEMAELLYNKAHMSEGDVDALLDIVERSNGSVPFSDHTDLYAAIDGLTVGDVPWQSFTVQFNGELGDDVTKPNQNYEGGMDFGPYRAFDKDGTRVYEHMMSGDWAWEQALRKSTATALGFEGSAVSYFTPRLLHPLQLMSGMSEPEVVRCADGFHGGVVYGLGPYIADYPEQVLISGIVTGWCPKCTAPKDELETLGHPRSSEHTDAIQELLGLGELWNIYGIVGDVKGTFKDHLVQWVTVYIRRKHTSVRVEQRKRTDFLARIAAAPPFAGLRRFHEGRGFKQWTGDDSKALMKITLTELEGALAQFNEYRTVFQEEGVREDFSLPRQHSMHHYPDMIRFFGAPNGLCSSITEAKHIKAVKEPWHRSNRNKPLKQMLLTNQRLDKLMAARILYTQGDARQVTT